MFPTSDAAIFFLPNDNSKVDPAKFDEKLDFCVQIQWLKPSSKRMASVVDHVAAHSNPEQKLLVEEGEAIVQKYQYCSIRNKICHELFSKC